MKKSKLAIMFATISAITLTSFASFAGCSGKNVTVYNVDDKQSINAIFEITSGKDKIDGTTSVSKPVGSLKTENFGKLSGADIKYKVTIKDNNSQVICTYTGHFSNNLLQCDNHKDSNDCSGTSELNIQSRGHSNVEITYRPKHSGGGLS